MWCPSSNFSVFEITLDVGDAQSFCSYGLLMQKRFKEHGVMFVRAFVRPQL
jgi:hypothetical protein